MWTACTYYSLASKLQIIWEKLLKWSIACFLNLVSVQIQASQKPPAVPKCSMEVRHILVTGMFQGKWSGFNVVSYLLFTVFKHSWKIFFYFFLLQLDCYCYLCSKNRICETWLGIFDNKRSDVQFEFIFWHTCQSVQQKSQFHRNKTWGNSCSGVEVLWTCWQLSAW